MERGARQRGRSIELLLDKWTPLTSRLLGEGGTHAFDMLDGPHFYSSTYISTCPASNAGSNSNTTTAQHPLGGEKNKHSVDTLALNQNVLSRTILHELVQGGLMERLKPARTTSDVKVDHLLRILASNPIIADRCPNLPTPIHAPPSPLPPTGRMARKLSVEDNVNQRPYNTIRGDLSCFISQTERQSPTFAKQYPSLAKLIAVLEATVTKKLAESIYMDPSRTSVQIAEYPGDGQSGYPRHCDRTQCTTISTATSITTRGPTNQESPKTPTMSKATHQKPPERILTAIFYLNDGDWDAEKDGGILRLFHSSPLHQELQTATTTTTTLSFTDIVPYADRLVVFRSDCMEHQVLPSLQRPRRAITVWLYGHVIHSQSRPTTTTLSSDALTAAPPVTATSRHDNEHLRPKHNSSSSSCSPLLVDGQYNLNAPLLPLQTTNNMDKEDDTIFVSIAAYRDSETGPTLQHLFNMSKHPHRIYVGLVLQVDLACSYDQTQIMAQLPTTADWYRNQVRIVQLDARHSTGPCPARAMAQLLYRGETFVLQIDSHMRFRQNWDSYLIQQLSLCTNPQFSLMTTYPLAYNLLPNGRFTITDSNTGISLADETRGSYLVPWKFDADGMPRQKGILFGNNDKNNNNCITEAERRRVLLPSQQPVACHLFAAGFCFGPASWIEDCPYDGTLHHLFFGEEQSMAVRLYTHGYDLYAPSEAVCFHLWSRDHRPVPSSPPPSIQNNVNTTTSSSNKKDDNNDTMKRIMNRKHAQEIVQRQVEQGEGPGLGTKRSVRDWARVLVVNFVERTIGGIESATRARATREGTAPINNEQATAVREVLEVKIGDSCDEAMTTIQTFLGMGATNTTKSSSYEFKTQE